MKYLFATVIFVTGVVNAQVTPAPTGSSSSTITPGTNVPSNTIPSGQTNPDGTLKSPPTINNNTLPPNSPNQQRMESTDPMIPGTSPTQNPALPRIPGATPDSGINSTTSPTTP